MDRLTACLTLRLLPGVGPITAQKIVQAYGSPEAVFQPDAFPQPPPNARWKQLLQQAEDLQDEVTTLKNLLLEQGVQPLVWGTPDYPPALARCPDAPLVVFVKGQLPPNFRKYIAIVGTRKPSRYGRDQCQSLVKALAPHGAVIVSGLAYGIDQTAHSAALANGLETVACLPHSLDRAVYPAAHQGLARLIQKLGALVSYFLHSQGFERGNFIQRNRLIAGLCHATIVIESGATGGSLITAQFADQYHREVFALPGSVDSDKSKGCHKLIQQHKAQLFDSVVVLLESLDWSLAKNNTQKSLPLTLAPKEQQLYQLLLQQGRLSLDDLAHLMQWTIAETAVVLMQMEMKKAIRPLPAKYFEAL